MKSQKMEEEYEKQLHKLEESKIRAVAELKEHYEKTLKHKSVLLEEVGSLICTQPGRNSNFNCIRNSNFKRS